MGLLKVLLAVVTLVGALLFTSAAMSGGSEPTGEVFLSAPARSAQGVNEEIFRLRANGSARRRLTHNGSSDVEADVDADRRRVVFVRYMSGPVAGFTTLWIMDANGRRIHKLIGAREFPPEWPRWSSSGRWLAFQSQCGFGSFGRPDDTCIEISIIRPDGSMERRLAKSSTVSSRESVTWGTACSWSGDDRLIAFERRTSDEGEDSLEVAVVDVETGEVRVVTAGAQPAFSPRSPVLAVVKGRRIAIVRTDGSFVRWASAPPPGWRDQTPSWSPDARQIAFWRTRLDGEVTKLIVLRIGSRTLRTVVVHDAQLGRIVWSPDGRYVAFTAFRLRSSSYEPWTYLVEVDAGGGAAPLARGPVWDWVRQGP